MKNIIKHELDKDSSFNKLFITGYQLNGESIKVNYGDNKFKIITPYTKEKEIEILDAMKKQAQTMYDYKGDLTKKRKSDIVYLTIYTALAFLNGAFFLNNNSKTKYVNLAAILLVSLAGGSYAVLANIGKKNIEELEKYKYLIENEDTINHEIALRYFDFYGKDADINEANRITLNNIDNYTLEDLKSIVELIESSDEYKLEHKRA